LTPLAMPNAIASGSATTPDRDAGRASAKVVAPVAAAGCRAAGPEAEGRHVVAGSAGGGLQVEWHSAHLHAGQGARVGLEQVDARAARRIVGVAGRQHHALETPNFILRAARLATITVSLADADAAGA
jgi:hypothetical protein